MAIKQLNPPLWLETPKGIGLAHLVIDYGMEADLLWVCFQDDTGEVWCWGNQDVRAMKNISLASPREKVSVTSMPDLSPANPKN